jgi:transcriptional regulator with XRE-family HTH domain
MDKLSTIGERLTDAMKQAKVSASDLARACGVSATAVHKWTRGGKLSADNLPAASRALGVCEDWLRTGKLPRERQHAEEERDVDQIIGILEGLREPLGALAAAIDKLGKVRPSATRKRRAS